MKASSSRSSTTRWHTSAANKTNVIPGLTGEPTQTVIPGLTGDLIETKCVSVISETTNSTTNVEFSEYMELKTLQASHTTACTPFNTVASRAVVSLP